MKQPYLYRGVLISQKANTYWNRCLKLKGKRKKWGYLECEASGNPCMGLSLDDRTMNLTTVSLNDMYACPHWLTTKPCRLKFCITLFKSDRILDIRKAKPLVSFKDTSTTASFHFDNLLQIKKKKSNSSCEKNSSEFNLSSLGLWALQYIWSFWLYK